MALRQERTFHAASGDIYYTVITRQSDGYMYNYVSGAYEASPSALNAGIPAPEVSTGTYKMQIPDDLTGGNVDVVLYQEIGGARDFATDTLVNSFSRSTGGIFGF